MAVSNLEILAEIAERAAKAAKARLEILTEIARIESGAVQAQRQNVRGFIESQEAANTGAIASLKRRLEEENRLIEEATKEKAEFEKQFSEILKQEEESRVEDDPDVPTGGGGDGLSDKDKKKQEAAERARESELQRRQEAEEELFEFLLTQEEKEIQQINQKFDKIFELGVANHEQELELMEMQQAEIDEVTDERRRKDEESRKKAFDQEIKDELALFTAKKNIQQETTNLIQSAAVLAGRVAKEESAAQKAALALQKAAAIASIAINLQKEIHFIRVNSAANPLNLVTAGTVGVAQSAAQTALAIGRAAVSTGVVLSQKFEDGGIIKGASHKDGGVPFSVGGSGGFEAEGGEAIINARSTAMFGDLLSDINVAGGGKSFFQDGGITPTIPSQPSLSTAEIVSAINSQDFQPVVSVVEIESARSNVAVTESEASI